MKFFRKYNCLIKSCFIAIAVFLISVDGFSQAAGNFMTASNYFDDGGPAKTLVENRRSGDLVFGLIEDFTQQYVTYKKATRKEDGTLITNTDILKGKGIYRKKGSEFFKLNFDGPVNIRWFGAIADSKTDNSESIRQAIAASSFIKIPAGNFAISSPIVITNSVQIVGDGFQQSKLLCTNQNMSAFVLGNENTTNLSLLNFSGFTIAKGKYAISATRDSGKNLFIERCQFSQLNFEEQSTAAVFIKGKKALFLVNTFIENVFRYCGAGIVLENVFSANLNHIQLNRFEGTTGGISITTANNELSQLTIHKNRFEAITSNTLFSSPIKIAGGNQNVSIADNYFEDVPEPVISFDAGPGISIAPFINSNQFSANIKGKVMIKIASQASVPNISSNVFKPGQAGVKIDFSTYVSNPVIQGNHGDISFVNYPMSFESFQKKDRANDGNPTPKKINLVHSGNFNFDLKLPSPGVFTLTLAVAEDGDFSLGGVASFKIAWIKGDAPLAFVERLNGKNNPNTLSISVSNPNRSGLITVNVLKADKKQRTAAVYYSINPDLDIDMANVQGN